MSWVTAGGVIDAPGIGERVGVIQLVEEVTQLAVPQEVVECPSSVIQLVEEVTQLAVPQEVVECPSSVAQAVQSGRPVGQGAQSSQGSQSGYQPQQQQVAQQSGRQSSSSSGSRTEFCGFCGGKHPSTQCVGVQGSYNLCGQYGHFARVCPSAGSQQTAAQPQGR
ncbi:hypothetical protein F511_26819 [Dorcoceras hygrometricum]|uniref:CCHC-type domain-containing protein n=1 Tax=Dorcoceras hygrometricum TaxID=472368 RepID=A0A2Z7CT98_9LAMI|nr:hypothetical protein F511_26819 [Dorcoceras hygrometricum]